MPLKLHKSHVSDLVILLYLIRDPIERLISYINYRLNCLGFDYKSIHLQTIAQASLEWATHLSCCM